MPAKKAVLETTEEPPITPEVPDPDTGETPAQEPTPETEEPLKEADTDMPDEAAHHVPAGYTPPGMQYAQPGSLK